MSERSPIQTIEIKTVDRAVKDWFDKKVDAHVFNANNEKEKVPIIFSSGERWATSRIGLRDINGILKLPILSIRRVSVVRDRTKSALGTQGDRLEFSKKIDIKTNIEQRNIAVRGQMTGVDNVFNFLNKNKNKQIYEITTIPFPDWFLISYEIVIDTQYTQQMNNILEKLFSSFDLQNSFVMPVEHSISQIPLRQEDKRFDKREKTTGYYFMGFCDADLNDDGNFDEFTDAERIIRYTFNIEVPAYLILDKDGKKPFVQKEYSVFDISFEDENVCFIDDPNELDKIFKKY